MATAKYATKGRKGAKKLVEDHADAINDQDDRLSQLETRNPLRVVSVQGNEAITIELGDALVVERVTDDEE